MTWGYVSTTPVAACREASLPLHSVDQRQKIDIAVGFNEQIRHQTQGTGWRLEQTDKLASRLDGRADVRI